MIDSVRPLIDISITLASEERSTYGPGGTQLYDHVLCGYLRYARATGLYWTNMS